MEFLEKDISTQETTESCDSYDPYFEEFSTPISDVMSFNPDPKIVQAYD